MSKFYTLNANSDVVTADDVVPSGTGTEVIATIGGKQIKAPAGGGGGGTVVKVANVGPDENGNVPLTAVHVGALPDYGGTVDGNLIVEQIFSVGQSAFRAERTGPGPSDVSVTKGGEELATEEQVEAAKTELNTRIDLIESTTKPNMNIVGSPKFHQGVVSGFSANDYLMFPTQVSVGQNRVEFYMSFTTGADVTTQQNLLDSWCGLALAIRDGHFVLAVSSNGTAFNTQTGSRTVSPNSSYSICVVFLKTDDTYDTILQVIDGEPSAIDAIVMNDGPLHPTTTYWGGANPKSGAHHIFGGTINLNECSMVWNGTTVWRGYDELPTVKFDPTAEPRLDTAEKIVGVIQDAVSLNNRFLVADTTASIQTREDEESDWADEIRLDKGYDAVQGDAMVKLDKSVQTVTVDGGTLAVVFPDAVDGTVRDLCLYVNNTNSTTECEMTFQNGTYYGADGWDAAAQKGGITGYYFSEIPGNGWRVSREELKQFTKGA